MTPPRKLFRTSDGYRILGYGVEHAREAAKLESELRKNGVDQERINSLMGIFSWRGPRRVWMPRL